MLLVILLVATAIRLLGTDFALWLDETASLALARQPLSNLWGEWMLCETNPPLFGALLKEWQAIVGPSDPVARTLPIAVGLFALRARRPETSLLAARGPYDLSAVLRQMAARQRPIGSRERNPLLALWDC